MQKYRMPGVPPSMSWSPGGSVYSIAPLDDQKVKTVHGSMLKPVSVIHHPPEVPRLEADQHTEGVEGEEDPLARLDFSGDHTH